MYYVLQVLETDEFDNPTSAYGYCDLNGQIAEGCFMALVSMVLFCIILGNFVCFVARNDESVNNEVTYISISMINFLEMMVVGGPVAVILVEEPTYRFLVVAFCGLVMFGGCV